MSGMGPVLEQSVAATLSRVGDMLESLTCLADAATDLCDAKVDAAAPNPQRRNGQRGLSNLFNTNQGEACRSNRRQSR